MTPLLLPVAQGRLGMYLSHRLPSADRLHAASTMGAVTVRGEVGAAELVDLRAAGWQGDAWLDPADWENAHSHAGQLSILGPDPWLLDQQAAGVMEFLSPGSYVAPADFSGLVGAIAAEVAWLALAGSGRMSLTLHHWWLTDGRGRLVRELGAAGVPLSLSFADNVDPLGNDGTVAGLVDIVSTVPEVMVSRADMAAVGAVANGADVGMVGSGGSVRHAVPPGEKPGGSGVSTPSVFVLSLLGWKQPTTLLRLPAPVTPTCPLGCCGGAPLSRFATSGTDSDLRRHNAESLAVLFNALLQVAPAGRSAWWKNAAGRAVREAARIATGSGAPFDVSNQVAQWAFM